MRHAPVPRSLEDAVALLNSLDLENGTHRALDLLLRTPGAGSWSRVAHLRIGRHHLTVRDLWKRIAPARRRHARPADFIRDMSRGRPMQPFRNEEAEYPERIFEVFPLLVAIAAELPERSPDSGSSEPSA